MRRLPLVLRLVIALVLAIVVLICFALDDACRYARRHWQRALAHAYSVSAREAAL